MIIRTENGEVRIVSGQEVAFEERTIDGVKCYISIEDIDSQGQVMKPEYAQYDVIKLHEDFYACDKDSHGHIQKMHNLRHGTCIKYAGCYLKVGTIDGEDCLYGCQTVTDDIRAIYFFETGEWFEHKDGLALSCVTFLNKVYVLGMKSVLGMNEPKAKCLYDFEDETWVDLGEIYEDEYIELREFRGEAYVYICEAEVEHGVYSFETNKTYRGCPKVELQENDNKLFVFGKNMRDKIKKIVDVASGDEATTQWDKLSLAIFTKSDTSKKFYAYDLDEDGILMGIYSFTEKMWARTHYNRLAVYEENKKQIHVCDVKDEKIVGIFNFEIKENWLYSKYGYLKIDGSTIYDCNSEGKIIKTYWLSSHNIYYPDIYFDV